ncbi:MAG: SGNH/GDSL hydrolase family protein [Candidatus Aminicenantes bacterium]|nr:SGNH/GDSL hydrolase family protein [Candidatus Aminicenantes bacterium]
MKKNLFRSFFIYLIIFLNVSLIDNLYCEFKDNELFIEKGKIQVKGEIYDFEKSYYSVSVYDDNKNLVFKSQVKSPDEVLLGFDYIYYFNSFVVFKQKFDTLTSTFSLLLESEYLIIPLISDSENPFYTPVFLEKNGNLLILYITESFSIKVYNIFSNLHEGEIKFQSPVVELSKDLEKNQIKFLMFYNGRYRKFIMNIDDVIRKRYSVKPLFSGEEIYNEKTIYRPYKQRRIKNNDITLDYRKFVGFGDSITYGYINYNPAPEKGYIPRLQVLIDSELYEGEVINEGAPATKTTDAVGRIEPVILEHKGKFLLFHYGTNDAIALSIPVSLVIYNITFIMDKALDYKVVPILSTLIPRDPNHWSGSGIFRQRAIQISEGINEIAVDNNISIIDFWDIFSNYPVSYGGYFSLMSDYVHPSENGYQLMAEEWLMSFKSLLPQRPEKVIITKTSPYRVVVQWSKNYEPNFSHYVIEFGYSPERLDRIVTTYTNSYEFICFFPHYPFYSQLYFRIQAVDYEGDRSKFTPVYKIEFK